MKRNVFAVLFSVLLIASCLFAACSTRRSPHPNDTQSESDTSLSSYHSMIRDLEKQISELQQMQYLSNSEHKAELERLQKLLTELKGEKESEKESQTGTEDQESESNSELPESKFLYTVKDGYAIITGYTGEVTQLVIPSHIDGYAVSEIGDNAFSSTKLKSVVITEGIQIIGWFAFRDCPSISSVTIPSSVKSIGYSAFPPEGTILTIYCHADSFAQKYAKSYGISYAII